MKERLVSRDILMYNRRVVVNSISLFGLFRVRGQVSRVQISCQRPQGQQSVGKSESRDSLAAR